MICSLRVLGPSARSRPPPLPLVSPHVAAVMLYFWLLQPLSLAPVLLLLSPVAFVYVRQLYPGSGHWCLIVFNE